MGRGKDRTHTPRTRTRRRTRTRILLLALALAPSLALGAGCGSDSSKQDAAAAARARAQAARHARAMALGRRVFAEHCHSCHTIAGNKAHPTFIESPIPNLDQVKPRREYAEQRVENGGFDMPSLRRELSEAEFAAVVTYVTEVAGRDVGEPETDAAVLNAARGSSRTTANAATASPAATSRADRPSRAPTSTASPRAPRS